MEVHVPDKEYNFDVCIVLDTADINRLGRRKSFLKNKVSYNIDHHKTNDGYAMYNFINADVSSVGEIIYDLFTKMKASIDHDIAQAIYVAIATDTGGFRYQNTNKNCFIISSRLMDYDINVEKISEWVFERTSMNKLYLFKNTIKNIKLYFDNRVAISVLRREEYMHLDVADEDFEGLVNVVKNIEGVEVGVFLRERNSDREVKGSLRSNTDEIDVSVIAKTFGGGGHARAAGLSCNMTLDQVYDGMIEKLNEVYGCTE
jgi:phosphoesterase RecJ-like protein